MKVKDLTWEEVDGVTIGRPPVWYNFKWVEIKKEGEYYVPFFIEGIEYLTIQGRNMEFRTVESVKEFAQNEFKTFIIKSTKLFHGDCHQCNHLITLDRERSVFTCGLSKNQSNDFDLHKCCRQAYDMPDCWEKKSDEEQRTTFTNLQQT